MNMNIADQKLKLIREGKYKPAEEIDVISESQEVIDTIAKKDYSKESLIQNTAIGTPRNMFFEIKKGDPIKVIKTRQKTNFGDNILYSLKKHNGQDFANTIEEESKMAIKTSADFRGNFGVSSIFNLPKDVVEEPTIVEKIKELASPNKKNTANLLQIVLIGVVAFVIYKVVKQQQ